MGKLNSKSLLALGFKHRRELVPFNGGYRHRRVRTRDDGELYWLCYTKNLEDQFEVTINNGGLFEMGLCKDEEKNGRIVPHGQRIEGNI